MTDLQDPKAAVPRRIEALNAAWAAPGAPAHEEAREALRTIAWSEQAPAPLRLAALRRLVDDPASEADARKTARLMVPLEHDLAVVELLGDAAARRAWTELTPPLIRSLSRPGKGPDSERPEARSLLALNPGKTLPEIAFAVFLRPAPPEADNTPESASGTDSAQRTRAAAWDLLGRLDADGSVRAKMLGAENHADQRTDRAVADLRACLTDLRTVPITGGELTWLQSLRDPANTADPAWWIEAASAISKLTPDQAGGLRLRDAEPVRWAAANRPAWLAADRAALLTELSSRLADRTIHQRQIRADVSKLPASERLADNEGRLSWADLLSILVIDDAIHDPGVVGQLFDQAAKDHDDRTTEYGGLLLLPPGGFRAVSYPPRPTQRVGDNQFVASADMLAQGDPAIAHYHFHAAQVFNSSFSGPSEGDLAYAARYGRACLVFTSTAPGILSADYYQPDGVDIDLGELRAPAP